MMKISIAQINSKLGNLAFNSKIILDMVRKASLDGSDVLITPELSLTGYPPEDLLLRPGFIEKVNKSLESLISAVYDCAPDLTVIVGHPSFSKDRKYLFNTATVFREGKIISKYGKLELPNYAVFDERRYFDPDGSPCVFKVKEVNCAINICEDVWFPRAPKMAKAAGADILLVLNASPFHLEKHKERIEVVKKNICKIGLPSVFCNLVGGQDELIFDGNSFVMSKNGKILASAQQFKDDFITFNFSKTEETKTEQIATQDEKLSQIYKALILGTKDYARKNGFRSVIVGLSGGIDSALTLAIAVESMGSKNVTAVMMPSQFTSKQSLNDAKLCSYNLEVELQIIDIKTLMQEFESSLQESFRGLPRDETEENLQSRIRGTLLMALSNKKKSLLLTTGNKSEIAVGYCTLYGDMCGGYSVLKDVFKTQIYKLARFINNSDRHTKNGPIPISIIDRPPSAELSHNQLDEDSLPTYEVLDAILIGYIEKHLSFKDLLNLGYPEVVVVKVLELIKKSEFKRRQSAPGPKITKISFGRDWRYPISNNYFEYGDKT